MQLISFVVSTWMTILGCILFSTASRICKALRMRYSTTIRCVFPKLSEWPPSVHWLWKLELYTLQAFESRWPSDQDKARMPGTSMLTASVHCLIPVHFSSTALLMETQAWIKKEEEEEREFLRQLRMFACNFMKCGSTDIGVYSATPKSCELEDM